MSAPYEKLVSEDMNLGYGDTEVTMPAGGIAIGQKVGIHTFVPRTFNVLDFGAVGDAELDGSGTDDTLAIRRAVEVAIAVGPSTVLFPPRRYKITDTIDLQGASNLRLSGYGATILMCFTAADKKAFYSNAYEVIASTAPTADINSGIAGRHLNVTNSFTLQSASGFAVGQYLFLNIASGDHAYTQIVKLKTLVGAAVTTEELVCIPVLAAQSGSIAAVTLGVNLYIEGFHFDATNATGSTSLLPHRAIDMRGYRNSTIIDCSCDAIVEGGFVAVWGYQNSFTRIKSYNSGGPSGGNSPLIWWYQTKAVFDNLTSDKGCFGFTILGSTTCQFTNIRVENSVGRGIKLYALAYCSGSNFLANLNPDATGWAVFSCYNCVFSNVVSNGNSTGIDINGLNNKQNQLHGGVAFGNSFLDLVVASTGDGVTEDKNCLYGIRAGTIGYSENGATGMGNRVVYAEDVALGTSVAGAVTMNSQCGTVTTEALTTAAGATYTLQITNNRVFAFYRSVGAVHVSYGTANAGTPIVGQVIFGGGTITIQIHNIHASAALNGTLKITYMVA